MVLLLCVQTGTSLLLILLKKIVWIARAQMDSACHSTIGFVMLDGIGRVFVLQTRVQQVV